MVITDMKMKRDDSGLIVIKKVKERYTLTQVIVFTAYTSIENADRCMEGGAFGYVDKTSEVGDPFERLFSKVEKALEKTNEVSKMNYKSEQLPKEVKEVLSKTYLANESEYWRQRDQLVQQFPNKWIAVHNSQVVTVGEEMTAVMDEVGKQGFCDAYIEKVGGEFETVFTIRHRARNFPYDISYKPPIPCVQITFLNFQRTHKLTYDDVIPDTGADHTILPLNDTKKFSLFSSPFYNARSGGIDSIVKKPTLIYRAFAEINGVIHPACIEAHLTHREHLLGRDVLNALVVIFDGPGRTTTFQL